VNTQSGTPARLTISIFIFISISVSHDESLIPPNIILSLLLYCIVERISDTEDMVIVLSSSALCTGTYLAMESLDAEGVLKVDMFGTQLIKSECALLLHELPRSDVVRASLSKVIHQDAEHRNVLQGTADTALKEKHGI
jgi:hypothetical protein